MALDSGADLVFVSHPVAGVHRIPRAWLDGFGPSGFRLATAAEISRWHDERALEQDAPAGHPAAAREDPPLRSAPPVMGVTPERT